MSSTPDNKRPRGGRLILFNSLPSTNRWALDNAASLLHCDVVMAKRQTGGRGRFERTWISPGDRGLAISVVLKPASAFNDPPCVPGFAGALAVRAALDRFSIKAQVKWPNDVLVDGRKIAGILAEQTTDTIVLGIGVNVNLTRKDIAAIEPMQPATSMAVETNRRFSMKEVCEAILCAFDETFGRQDAAGLIALWRQNDYLIGRNVEVRSANERITGVCVGIHDDGRLLVRDSAGAEHSFWSGDAVAVE